MPQMSPLLWANLFAAFSILLLVSLFKIYFSNSKNLDAKKFHMTEEMKKTFSWTW